MDWSAIREKRLNNTAKQSMLNEAMLSVVIVGLYAPAILRFQISFPATYPILPPIVSFSSDVFHPLVTPLTTYMYTTDIQDGGTVSATDDERLPPGGFSLRHGFPGWVGRSSKSPANSRQTSGQYPPRSTTSPGASTSGQDTPDSSGGRSPTIAQSTKAPLQPVSIYEVLRYMRSAFDDEDVLDAVPLEAAGNPGAWHAWRAHRIKKGKSMPLPSLAKHEVDELGEGSSDGDHSPAVPEGYQRVAGGTSPRSSKKPAEWNWDGVWEVRSKRGIDGSLAESVLYGNITSNDELVSGNI
jgi:hypothetical protein